jgi:hypothetical protein
VTLDDALARLSNDIRAQHPFITRVQSQTTCTGDGNNVHSGGSSATGVNDVSSGAACRKPSIISPSQLGPGTELAMSSHLGDEEDNESRLHMQQQNPAVGTGGVPFAKILHNGGDPFANILTLADSNLSQAESILSSLGCGERTGLPSDSEDEEEGGGGPVSLGSDIESNIRRLERTQAKINAALQTFRYLPTGPLCTLEIFHLLPCSATIGNRIKWRPGYGSALEMPIPDQVPQAIK